MHKLVKQQTAWIWIALLGVLFSALAPAMSHAMAANAIEEVQMCTMDGVVTVMVDQGQSGKSTTPAPDHMFKHCPYCAAHGGAASLPPAVEFVFPVILQATAYPSLFYQSATPLFSWTAANPRAPPAIA
jgi:hypothetical protein